MLATDCRRALAIVLVSGALACAHNPAPRYWLAPAEGEQADPYGAWIVVSKMDARARDVSGEFLGVSHDSVFVLLQDSRVLAIPADSVRTAQVASYESKYMELVVWTAAGSLGTISNGYFLLFTLPAMLIDGAVASTTQSVAPIRRVDGAVGWDAVRMFARFPEGIPDHLPRTLPPKPPVQAWIARKR
jgi:hypothetical protein